MGYLWPTLDLSAECYRSPRLGSQLLKFPPDTADVQWAGVLYGMLGTGGVKCPELMLRVCVAVLFDLASASRILRP